MRRNLRVSTMQIVHIVRLMMRNSHLNKKSQVRDAKRATSLYNSCEMMRIKVDRSIKHSAVSSFVQDVLVAPR